MGVGYGMPFSRGKGVGGEEQVLWVEVALVELMVGMALHLPVDVVEVVLEFMSNL